MTAQLSQLDAAAILAIPAARPEKLFRSSDMIAATFRAFARLWHPDANTSAQAPIVFAHLVALRDEAERRRDAGQWRGAGRTAFDDGAGHLFELRYACLHETDVADVYVGKNVFVQAFKPDAGDLAANARAGLGALRFDDKKTSEMFSPRLPNIAMIVERRDGLLIVQRKTSGEIPLIDLLDLSGGRLDPRHVAWIVSDLLATATMLDTRIGIVLPVLDPANLLVRAGDHIVRIAGGFEFAARSGEKLLALPSDVVAAMPAILLQDRLAKTALTLEAIRRVAARALGAANPTLARRLSDVPAPFGDWLVAPAPAAALDDYRAWERALDASFGPRRFLDLKVDFDAFYGAA